MIYSLVHKYDKRRFSIIIVLSIFAVHSYMTTRSERLKEARLKAKLSQSEVAAAVGIKQPSYNYLEKNNNAGSSHIAEIARVLNVDPTWLRTGVMPSNIDDEVAKLLENTPTPLLNSEYNDSNRVWVDLVNIRFSCGNGESIEFHFDDVIKKIPFDEFFFRTHNVKPEGMKLVLAAGDSQEPYVKNGDVFAIDLSDTDIRDGEFYAVYFEGEAMLKQILKEPGGVLVLHSLNSKYRDKIISPENGANFRVIGRQFWRAG